MKKLGLTRARFSPPKKDRALQLRNLIKQLRSIHKTTKLENGKVRAEILLEGFIPIANLKPGMLCRISGIITQLGRIRDFRGKDGSPRRVANI